MPFGISLGGNASKSKTTTSNTSATNRTTTPNVPEWGSNLVQRGAQRLGGLFDLDPAERVAPSNGLLDQAAGGAGALSTGAAGNGDWLKPYMEADTPFASGGKARDYVGAYLNPYLKDVVDASAADFDASAGQVRAQQALDLAGAGAFGGSGSALTRSLTEGELSRGRASTLAGLRSRGWETALGAAAGDADRATQARISNAHVRLQDQAQKVGFGFQGRQQALAANADQRANIATQAELGGLMRGIETERRAAPVTTTGQIVAMLSGLPISLFTGESEAETTASSGTSKTKQVGVSASVPGKIGSPAK